MASVANGIKPSGLAFLGTSKSVDYVVSFGASGARLPETDNRWYTPVSSDGAYVSIFDEQLIDLKLSTYLIGADGEQSFPGASDNG